jgi:hypothetical protein
MKKVKIKIVGFLILFVSFSVFPVNAGTRYLSAMKSTIIRDVQSSSGSFDVKAAYQEIGGGGSSSSSASGAVIGVNFSCTIAIGVCETSDQQFVRLDGSYVKMSL